MKTEEQHKFIAETSMRILAAMFTNPTVEPNPKKAIENAEKLWDELIEKRIV